MAAVATLGGAGFVSGFDGTGVGFAGAVFALTTTGAEGAADFAGGRAFCAGVGFDLAAAGAGFGGGAGAGFPESAA